MKIIRKAKKYEEIAEVLSLLKSDDKKKLSITFFHFGSPECLTLQFETIEEMNDLYNKIISNEVVDISNYL